MIPVETIPGMGGKNWLWLILAFISVLWQISYFVDMIIRSQLEK
jgi:hypothetical protein